jgi:hypothetical protein
VNGWLVDVLISTNCKIKIQLQNEKQLLILPIDWFDNTAVDREQK